MSTTILVANVREPVGLLSGRDYHGLVDEHGNGDMEFATRADAENYLRICGYEPSSAVGRSTDGGTVDYWFDRHDFNVNTTGMSDDEILDLYGDGCEPALYVIEIEED